MFKSPHSHSSRRALGGKTSLCTSSTAFFWCRRRPPPPPTTTSTHHYHPHHRNAVVVIIILILIIIIFRHTFCPPPQRVRNARPKTRSLPSLFLYVPSRQVSWIIYVASACYRHWDPRRTMITMTAMPMMIHYHYYTLYDYSDALMEITSARHSPSRSRVAC